MEEAAPEGRWVGWLASPLAGRLAPLLAAAFGLTTLPMAFYSDDWTQIAQLQGRGGPLQNPPWDLYRFATGAPEQLRAMQLAGPMPWFADPHLKLAFLRPVASLLLALDHAVFGLAPLGWHLHAILWYVAAVVLVRAILVRALPGSRAVANLAALLFAVDAAHMEPVGWLACRHMLVGAVPALGALLAHVGAREGRFRAGVWLAPLLLLVGLAGSEASLGVLGYLVAYELFGPPRADGRPLGERARALLPYGALLVPYVVVYKVHGCGAAANGAYFDPATDPIGFVGAAADRLPILFANLFWGAPADLCNVVPHAPFWIAGGLGLLVFGALGRSVLGDLAASERTALAWLVPGALVAMLAGLGGFPGARLLLLPSIAGAAFFALVLVRALRSRATGSARFARRAGWTATLVFHAILAPIQFATAGPTIADGGKKLVDAALEADLGPDVENARVIVVAASDPFGGFYSPAPRVVLGKPLPKAWNVVSMAKTTHRVSRVAADRLRVRFLDAPMMRGAFEVVFRSPAKAFTVGDRVDLDGMAVTVTEVDAGMPREIEISTSVPLDDPGVRLVAWQKGALRRLPALAVGDVIEIPWSPGPTGLF